MLLYLCLLCAFVCGRVGGGVNVSRVAVCGVPACAAAGQRVWCTHTHKQHAQSFADEMLPLLDTTDVRTLSPILRR